MKDVVLHGREMWKAERLIESLDTGDIHIANADRKSASHVRQTAKRPVRLPEDDSALREIFAPQALGGWHGYVDSSHVGNLPHRVG
jgi:hypothetical protein